MVRKIRRVDKMRRPMLMRKGARKMTRKIIKKKVVAELSLKRIIPSTKMAAVTGSNNKTSTLTC